MSKRMISRLVHHLPSHDVRLIDYLSHWFETLINDKSSLDKRDDVNVGNRYDANCLGYYVYLYRLNLPHVQY